MDSNKNQPQNLPQNSPQDQRQASDQPQNLNYNASAKSFAPLPQSGLEKMFTQYSQEQQELSTQEKAKKLGLPYINLRGYPVNSQTLALIPEEIARKYHVVAFMKAAGKLTVATTNPTDVVMKTELAKIAEATGLDIVITVASKDSLEYALQSYKFVPKITSKEIKVSQQEEQNFIKQIKNLTDLKNKISQIPTTQIFETILAGAIKSSASDIHIEPVQNGMRLRYRIDGVLQDVAQMPLEAYRALLSRVKYLANMKLDIKDKPQNGRFSITAINVPVDLRVSTVPTIYGENIVMRLLKHGQGFLTLEKLEFSQHIKEMVAKNIKKPSGMILNTGPTGSGKTTTLYAILDKLNKPGVKIITIEDPVEYRIQGINQTQANPTKESDFANLLKAALRQDPDIIMVGEIRDLATAETAIQAAMTGHLVLSTLHTNNAPASMPRMIDLGIQPFLLPGSINMVMAQRLVRKICLACREAYTPDPGVMEKIKKVLQGNNPSRHGRAEINIKIPNQLWRGRGCSQCNKTAFAGRIPIAEGFEPTPEIEKMVTERTPISLLYKKAVESGMITMEQDGIQKVLQGLTTIDEIWRVTASEE